MDTLAAAGDSPRSVGLALLVVALVVMLFIVWKK